MPVGAPTILKLARRWGGADVRAAALLRRADARSSLPPASMLVLDVFDTVHLVALHDGLLLGVRETLMSWRPGGVRVHVQPGGGDNSRPVELRYDDTVLELAGPWRQEAQRDALELIEQVTLR
jgi:hypothetical protein